MKPLIKAPIFPIPIPRSTPLLRYVAEMHERHLREEAEQQAQILRLRVVTNWDERRIVDTAKRRNLSFTELLDLILKTGDWDSI